MATTGESRKAKTSSSTEYRRGICFGSFDPLHYGHIRLFKRAAGICDEVYAVTKENGIIRREKGRAPFTNAIERLDDLRGIKYVTGVGCVTEKWTRETWARILSADVLILGDDWEGRHPAEEELGLPVVYLPYTRGISSTIIREY